MATASFPKDTKVTTNPDGTFSVSLDSAQIEASGKEVYAGLVCLGDSNDNLVPDVKITSGFKVLGFAHALPTETLDIPVKELASLVGGGGGFTAGLTAAVKGHIAGGIKQLVGKFF